jgi:peptide/nickel transport system permease protein
MQALRYVGTRFALAVLTLFLISVVTFLATNVVPSDPARSALGKFATPAQVEAYREEQGLNRPVLTRYAEWLSGFVTGDWGTSVYSRQPVADQVVPRIARSVILAGAAMLIAVPIAFLLGVYTGQRSGRPADVGISFGALFVNSMPEFVVGLVLLVLFAVEAGVLPIESSAASLGSGAERVEAYILPVLTLAIVLTPYILRMVRVNVRDMLDRAFVRAAVLRGFSRRRVVWQHVVPNASLPVVSVVALSLAELIGGVVIIETVFGFPGIGNLLVDSVSSKDIPTVQAIALVVGTGYVVLNFAADAVILALNPRLRTTQ